MKKRTLRFSAIFIAPNLAFLLFALLVPAAVLIDAFNGAILALSVGVCVAYSPVIRNILGRYRNIDRADLLALGIFFGWFGIVLRTAWSLVWRYYGTPLEWLDTHFTSYFLFTSLCAAGFHLLAPGAIDSRVPTWEWVRVGLLCSAGVMAMFLAFWLLGNFPLTR